MTNNILEHKGLISLNQIDRLLSEFKIQSQIYDLRFALHKKIITVMIEALENVSKYKEEFEKLQSPDIDCQPSFLLQIENNTVKLTTSNPVKKEDIDGLKSKIDMVNSLNREELKKLYVSTITNGKFSPKGGAGLGFIEMAKVSGNSLLYSFDEIDKEYSNYTFIVTFTL